MLLFSITTLILSCNGNTNKILYIESDHSGSYYRIVKDGGAPFMILFDTHSDSELNEQFELDNNQKDIIYDYNWITPLLGREVETVWWIPPVKVNSKKEKKLNEEVLGKIKKSNLAERYKVMDLNTLKNSVIETPVTVSLDLDYFINFDKSKSQKIMKDIFEFMSNLKDLELATVSISSYYHYQTQGDSFVLLMLLENAKEYGYKIEFEPLLLPILQENTPKQFNFETVHPVLKKYLVDNVEEYSIGYNKKQVNNLVDKWKDEFARIDKYIQIANKSIRDEFIKNEYSELTYIDNGNKEQGVFIRLLKDSRQRGCFSFYRKVDNLEQAVSVGAINAAFYDNREIPLKEDELEDDMEIEISLVDEFKEIDYPSDFTLGHHTVLLVYGANRALIQPSLVFENNWSKEQYLEAIAVKAGLNRDSWKEIDARIFKADTTWLKKPI